METHKTSTLRPDFYFVDPDTIYADGSVDEHLPWGEDGEMWMRLGHHPLATQQRRFLVVAHRELGIWDLDAAEIMRCKDIAHLYLTVVAGRRIERRTGYDSYGSLHRSPTMHSVSVTAWLPEYGLSHIPYLPDHTDLARRNNND